MSNKGQTTYKNVKKWRKIDYERCIFIFFFLFGKELMVVGVKGER